MARLTDMQLVLLSIAATRDDGSLLPPAESLGSRFDRVRRSVQALIDKSFATEIVITEQAKSWRHDNDVFYGVMISEAGRAVLDDGEDANASSTGIQTAVTPVEPAAPAPDTKATKVVALLRRNGGASIAEIMELTGWLPHTSRAALTGLRKKGHAIEAAKVDGTTRYTIGAGA